jgi:pSer/pThr/pTyr-binding forkhead associated (FHA) protein
MQTQLLTQPLPSVAMLQYYSISDSRPERVTLDAFPFIVGRSETAELTVDSARVSREHARFDRQDARYVLEDLGSTNGTFVNGKKISGQIELTDGDLIAVADIEITFLAGAGTGPRRQTATQMMFDGPEDQRDALDLIGSLRRMQQGLTHRAMSVTFHEIIEYGKEKNHGYVAVDNPGDTHWWDEKLVHTECRWTSRLRHLQRLLAAEKVAGLPDKDALVFLPLAASEVHEDWAASCLGPLQRIVGSHRLVLELASSAACDIPYFRDFLQALREYGVSIAYSGFAGSAAQVREFANIPPDYLKFSPSVLAMRSSRDSSRNPVRGAISACREFGCRAIACTDPGNTATEYLQALGFSLMEISRPVDCDLR